MNTRRFVSFLVLLTLLVNLGQPVVDIALAQAMTSTAALVAPDMPPQQASPPTLTLIAPDGPQPVTDPVDVEVFITGATDLGAFEFDLEYDRALVQVTGITVGEFLGGTAGCDPGITRCAVALGPVDGSTATGLGAYSYGTGPGASGDGLLAVIHLQPTGVSGVVTLSMANPLIAVTTAVTAIPATQGTTLELTASLSETLYLPLILKDAAAITSTPTSKTSAQPISAASICPDFSADDQVDTDDLTAIASHWRQTSGEPGWDDAFDLDGDGVITIADIMQVAAAWGSLCLPSIGIEIALDVWAAVDEPVWGMVETWHLEQEPIQVTLVSGPDGLTFDPGTGVLSWTPLASQIGLHTVTVSATDGDVVAERTVQIEVSDIHPQATGVISAAAGGVLEVTDPSSFLFGIRLEFPPGALEEDTQITIGALSAPPPMADTLAGPPFALLPSDLRLLQPVTLTVPYDPTFLPPEVSPDDLVLRVWAPRHSVWHPSLDNPIWELKEPIEVDIVHQTVRASLNHFSIWGLSFIPFGPRRTLTTEHFRIVYWPYDPDDKPASSCRELGQDPTSGTCYPATNQLVGHPDYIADLSEFLEEAYNFYIDRGFALNRGPYPVEVGDWGYNRMYYVGYGLFIDNDQRHHSSELANFVLHASTAHELFHVVQKEVLNDHLSRPESIRLSMYSRWLDEATAEDMAMEVFVWPRRVAKEEATFARKDFLTVFGIDEEHPDDKKVRFYEDLIDRKEGYYSFPLFHYLRTTYKKDYTLLLYNALDPEIVGYPALGLRSHFYDRIAELVRDQVDLIEFWTKFGLAYHHLRDETLVGGVRHWGWPSRGVATNVPSGWERREPCNANEVAPLAIEALHANKMTDIPLKPGYVASYQINMYKVLCNPPTAHCNGADAIDPETGLIVLELESNHPGVQASIYQVSQSGAFTEIHRFDEGTGESTVFEIPLRGLYEDDVNQHDDLVVSFVNDPHQDTGNTGTVGVNVYFRDEGKINAGLAHSCAVVEHAVFCWGDNYNMALGTPTTETCWGGSPCSTVPIQVQVISGSSAFASVSAGFDQSCAVTVDGDAYCWGLNLLGSCGVLDGRIGTLADRVVPSPTLVFGDIKFKAISTGGGSGSGGTIGGHTCGLDLNGKAYCWGKNYSGQLGTSTNYCWESTSGNGLIEIPCSTKPVEVQGNITFKSISAGVSHTCGISSSNRAYCWGANDVGQLGVDVAGICGDPNPYPCSVSPVLVGNYKWISAAGSHTCAIDENDVAFCWGSNWDGQLGRGTVDAGGYKQLPVMGDLRFREITAGSADYHSLTCGITIDGQSYCWGRAVYGRLGNGIDDYNAIFSRPSPASLVSTNKEYCEISIGGPHSCAFAASGSFDCWGENNLGQLGVNTGETCREDGLIACSTTPVQVIP